jgi:hypothetical protein
MCHGNKLGATGVRRSKVIIFSPSENWQAGRRFMAGKFSQEIL